MRVNTAIKRVLANDPELAISHISVQQAGYAVKGAEGFFSPVLTVDTAKSRTVTPIATIIGGSESGKFAVPAQFMDQKLPGREGGSADFIALFKPYGSRKSGFKQGLFGDLSVAQLIN